MAQPADRRAERENQILRAAVRAFSLHGYHDCTVARVAREAGVADGTLYLYFRSKEDLLVSAFRHVLGGILDRLDREMSAATDPVERLRRLVELHLQVMEDDPELASFLQFQLRQPDPAIRRAISDPLRAYARRIERAVDDGKASGVLRSEVPTRAVRRVLFGAIDETVSAWLLHGRDSPLRARAGPILDIVLNGVRSTRA